MLDLPGRERPYLRRAYSVADADTASGDVEFLVKTIGPGTAALADLPLSSPVSLLGPLGNGFSLDGLQRGERVAVVAGGIGAAPFPLLFRALAQGGLEADFYLGGRNAVELSLRERFETIMPGRIFLATDDGSVGGTRVRHRSLPPPCRAGGLRAALRLRPDADVRRPRPDRRAPGSLLSVLDRGGDGLRFRRVPGVRPPGRGKAVPHQLHGRTDPPAREIAWERL